MLVKDLMDKNIISVKRQTPFKKIIQIFRESNLRALPVVDDNRLIGIVSFDDITKIFDPYTGSLGRLLKTIPFLDEMADGEITPSDVNPELGLLYIADDLMNVHFVTVEEDMDIEQAYNLLKENKREFLYVTKDKKVVGYIELFDVIYTIFKEKGLV